MALTRIPALVDLHVHFRDPGFPDKEDFFSGGRAAAAGGFTTVCMMPNTNPPCDSAARAADAARRARLAAPGIRAFPVSAMTLGQNGVSLVDFAAMDGADTACRALTGHGVCGISEDGKTLASYALMEKVCEAAARLGLLIMDHAEPEAEIIRRDIALALKTGARFHIQHVSLAESAALIKEAKAAGAPVTCETAPHYFSLTDAEISRQGANAKMNPPLAKERDRLAIIEGLCDGTIDCIATDHAPHEAAVKNPEAVSLADAANGIVGLETAFPIAYTTLVKGGFMTLKDLTRLMSEAPAAIIGLPASALENDYALVDLDTPYEIDAGAFYSKGRNTPFHGRRVFGRVVKTASCGAAIYEAEAR